MKSCIHWCSVERCRKSSKHFWYLLSSRTRLLIADAMAGSLSGKCGNAWNNFYTACVPLFYAWLKHAYTAYKQQGAFQVTTTSINGTNIAIGFPYTALYTFNFPPDGWRCRVLNLNLNAPLPVAALAHAIASPLQKYGAKRSRRSCSPRARARSRIARSLKTAAALQTGTITGLFLNLTYMWVPACERLGPKSCQGNKNLPHLRCNKGKCSMTLRPIEIQDSGTLEHWDEWKAMTHWLNKTVSLLLKHK